MKLELVREMLLANVKTQKLCRLCDAFIVHTVKREFKDCECPYCKIRNVCVCMPMHVTGALL